MSCISRGRVWLAALGLLAPFGCRLESSWRPETQFVIDLDADGAVRARTTSLRVVVTGSDQLDELPHAEPSLDEILTFDSDAVHWPVRIVLKPPPGDNSRLFELHAIARDDSAGFVAEVRVTSGYVGGQVRQLHLYFTDACIEVECGDEQTCSAGHCGGAWIAPDDAALFTAASPARTGDAAADSGSAALDAAAGPPGDEADDGGLAEGMEPAQASSPCADLNGGCDVLVTCQSLFGVAICGPCPSGYDDVNGDGSLCQDRDECQDDFGGCDRAHGECINTPGGRECRCKQGYHGDGEHCSTQVPCTSDESCAEHARCVESDAARSCVCNRGYDGDGTSCVDVDECASHKDDCGAHGRCVNSDGGFDCACDAGYAKRDGTCQDVDECEAGGDDCDDQPDACVNDAGGFHCSCPHGYTGDGLGAMGCTDIDECRQNSDDCSAMPQACVNDAGGFHCQCPAGYVGDGRGASGCMLANECTMNTDNCDSSPDACVDDSIGFHCQCPSGYSGTGVGEDGCADIDECAMNRGGCDAMRECVNTPGGHHCGACASGYGASGTSGCAKCACYEQGGADACASRNEPTPANCARELSGSVTIPARTLFGYQVTLPANARVRSFGAYKKGSALTTIRIGLYADGAGQPGARMAQASQALFSGSSLSVAVSDGVSGCLAAGSYWLIAVSDDDIMIGQDTGTGVPSVRLALPLVASSELPANWPSGGTSSTDPPLNLYATLDHP